MKETTKKWLEFSMADIKAAEVQFKHGGKLGSSYQIAVFHCHQAVEKMLKAILEEQNKNIPKIHDLLKLLSLTAVNLPPEFSKLVALLNPHYLPPRYPDMNFKPQFHFTYNQTNVAKLIANTQTIILWLKKNLN